MNASGEAMPPAKWATSTCSRRSSSLTWRNVAGVNGMSNGSSGTSMRCTRTPSTTSDHDVVAGGHQVAGQVVHLHLDATEPGDVAVRHQAHLERGRADVGGLGPVG